MWFAGQTIYSTVSPENPSMHVLAGYAKNAGPDCSLPGSFFTVVFQAINLEG